MEVLPGFPLDREGLLAQLARRGISARRGIMAAHLQPPYLHTPRCPLPVTERLAANTLVLPVHHELTAEEQQRVVSALVTAVEDAA